MTPTKTVNLLMSEVSFMVKHGYIKVLCDCDNTVYVWRNKNLCDCHRARCLKCKNSKSYFLFSRKLKTGWVSQLSMFSDSYDDYRAALVLSACMLSSRISRHEDGQQ